MRWNSRINLAETRDKGVIPGETGIREVSRELGRVHKGG